MRSAPLLVLAIAAVAMASAARADDPGTEAAAYELSARLDSLRNVAAEDRPESIRELRFLLAEVERSNGEATLEAADVLDALVAVMLRSRTDPAPDVVSLSERVIAIRETLQGETHVDLAASLLARALIHRRAGEMNNAWRLASRALDIRDRTLPENDSKIISALTFCAGVKNSLREHDAALALAQRAVSCREATDGRESAEYASSLGLVAMTELYRGRLERSRELFENVVPILTAARGPEHPSTVRETHNLALVLDQLGDYAEARELFERLLEIRERTLAPTHPTLAKNLSALAAVLGETGDLERAGSLLERVLAIRLEVFDEDHPQVAAAYNDLGRIQLELGDVDGAAHSHERSLEIRERRFGSDHVRVALAAGNLGVVRMHQGRSREAEALFRRAIRSRTEAFQDSLHPEILSVQQKLGTLLLEMGEVASAESLIVHVVAGRTQRLGRRHPWVAESLLALAALRYGQGQLGESFDAAERAEQIDTEMFHATAPVLSERQAVSVATRLHDGLSRMIQIGSNGDFLRTARTWDALVRARSLVLNEMIERHRRAQDVLSPEARDLADALARTRRRLARAVVAEPGDDGETSGEHIEAIRAEKERLESELARRTTPERAPREIGLADVLTAMPTDAALVAYARANVDPVVREGSEERAGVYVAFVYAGGEPRVVPIGDADEVERRVAAWWREASRIEQGDGALIAADVRGVGRSRVVSDAAEHAYERVASDLRAMIWDPVAGYVSGRRHVYVVPDAALQIVNLASLPDGDRFLLETGPILHTLTSERALVRREERGGASKGVLVIGGVGYGVSMAVPCRHDFTPLPGAAAEATAVAALWQPLEPVVLLAGGDATEERFRRQATGKRILHLATHGFVTLDLCDGQPSAILNAARPTEVLLGAGFALAGANEAQRGATDGDDGIVTAEEIATLDLSETEWIVLSTCDSGLGATVPSEGMFGLRRSFEIAGARNVVASLWPVDDVVTLEWMVALHRARTAHDLDAATSVRDAALECLTRRRSAGLSVHPYFWGAFLATGT